MSVIETIKDLFAKELANVNRIFPEHDPFKGHRPEDKNGGKSYFFDKSDDWECPMWARETDRHTTNDGNKQLVSVQVVAVDTEPGMHQGVESEPSCGMFVFTTPITWKRPNVCVKKIHGCKQLVALSPDEWTTEEDFAETATVVLSREQDKDGSFSWCLASAFPGESGVGPEQLDDLEEGEVLSFFEKQNDGRVTFMRHSGDTVTLDVSHVVIEE